jgi:hypothetical protein
MGSLELRSEKVDEFLPQNSLLFSWQKSDFRTVNSKGELFFRITDGNFYRRRRLLGGERS